MSDDGEPAEEDDGGSDWEDVDLEDLKAGPEDAKSSSLQSSDFVDPLQSSDQKQSSSFVDIGKATDSEYSFASRDLVAEQQKDTRTDAERLGINFVKPEVLGTGEIKLGDKVIGHRQWNYIYKQKYKAPEERETQLIKKLAIEYQKMNIVAVRDDKHNVDTHIYIDCKEAVSDGAG